MEHADEMLEVAEEILRNEHYSSACNRAYYAIFYAASALLYSKGMSFGKHCAVLAFFRQHFIKTGEFDQKWSDDYEFILSSRQTADYELFDHLEKGQADEVVNKARAFVEEVEIWLRKDKHL
jgi:uncharacterized protein (UPF0332 family)